MPQPLLSALYAVGALLALVGAGSYITGWPLSPYLYMIGAGCFALAQFNTPLRHRTPTLRRLRTQQLFGSAFLLAAGVLMFFSRGNEWMLALTLAAVLQLYTAFRIPHEEGKADRP